MSECGRWIAEPPARLWQDAKDIGDLRLEKLKKGSAAELHVGQDNGEAAAKARFFWPSDIRGWPRHHKRGAKGPGSSGLQRIRIWEQKPVD